MYLCQLDSFIEFIQCTLEVDDLQREKELAPNMLKAPELAQNYVPTPCTTASPKGCSFVQCNRVCQEHLRGTKTAPRSTSTLHKLLMQKPPSLARQSLPGLNPSRAGAQHGSAQPHLPFPQTSAALRPVFPCAAGTKHSSSVRDPSNDRNLSGKQIKGWSHMVPLFPLTWATAAK